MLIRTLFLVILLTPFCAGAAADDVGSSSVEQLETKILHLINAYRSSKGLPDLALDSRLTRQARTHSRGMAAGEVDFGHDGFEERIEQSGIRIAAAAENVGTNRGMDDPARQAVQAWVKSPGHRTNIEGRYNLTGIGVARAPDGSWFFTQIFVKSRASKTGSRN